jgi:hypothetical protein
MNIKVGILPGTIYNCHFIWWQRFKTFLFFDAAADK